jgi:hypothetical protein
LSLATNQKHRNSDGVFMATSAGWLKKSSCKQKEC